MMPKADRDESRLRDMLENAKRAIEFAEGRTREDLSKDVQFQYALIRALEIIGEASRQVSDEKRKQYTEIAWAAIGGLRNRIVHDYNQVSLDVIWNVVQKELVPLVDSLENILKSLHKDDPEG
ncbi:MAG: DUF86 domain-containing protein [Phototrophicaceae bacterium]|jgi:uncharacterized protein with HEPN domain